MEYNELIELNSEKPRKALLYKALMEFQGSIEFYQEHYERDKGEVWVNGQDKGKYWQQKIRKQRKWKKAVVEKLEKVYKTKITNA